MHYIYLRCSFAVLGACAYLQTVVANTKKTFNLRDKIYEKDNLLRCEFFRRIYCRRE